MYSILEDVKPLKLKNTLEAGEQNKTRDAYLVKELLFKVYKNMKATLGNTGRMYFTKSNTQYRKWPILHWSVYINSCAKQQGKDEVIVYNGQNNRVTLV